MAAAQRKSSTLRTSKSRTLNLRISDDQKAAFEQAAFIQQSNVSNFILSNAYEAAQDVIQRQHLIAVSGTQWKTICQALDNPPKSNPALRKFLKSKSVFGRH
jgi:uncharacterized protein (DUF1778 family)